MSEESDRARAAFLAVLCPEGAPEGRQWDWPLDVLLCQDLDVFAHPRARAAARRQQPVDTLIEFLAGSALSQRVDRLREFGDWLRSLLIQGQEADGVSPRTAVIQRIESLLGRPAQGLAEELEYLIEETSRSTRTVDSMATTRLYFSAHDLCESWALALDDEYGSQQTHPRSAQADELFATEAVIEARVSPSEPFADYFEAADLIQDLTELLALEACGLINLWGWNQRSPALGWPATFAQIHYRLRQLMLVALDGAGSLVEGAAREPAGSPGHVPYLLDAYAGDLGGLTVDQPGAGFARIRRSCSVGTIELLHVLEALHDPATQDREALAVLRDCLRVLIGYRDGVSLPRWWSTRQLDLGKLPLNSWELRELFPELVQLLSLYGEAVRRGGWGEAHDPVELVQIVCDAYLELRGQSGRYLSALVAEISAICALFPSDERLDQALELLGIGERTDDPETPWWDQLTWHAWLRQASGYLMLQAERDRGGAR